MYLLSFCFWLLLNGRLTLEITLVGLVLTAVMALVLYGLFDYTPATEGFVLRKLPLLLVYVVVLVWEILKANLAVCACILRKNRRVEPKLVTFRSSVKTGFGRFLLANSITLTPGTITVSVDADRLTVHCLDGEMLDLSENGVFQRWIRRLER